MLMTCLLGASTFQTKPLHGIWRDHALFGWYTYLSNQTLFSLMHKLSVLKFYAKERKYIFYILFTKKL